MKNHRFALFSFKECFIAFRRIRTFRAINFLFNNIHFEIENLKLLYLCKCVRAMLCSIHAHTHTYTRDKSDQATSTWFTLGNANASSTVNFPQLGKFLWEKFVTSVLETPQHQLQKC